MTRPEMVAMRYVEATPNSAADSARVWWEAGYSVIPLGDQGTGSAKRPRVRWQDYQSNPCDSDQLERWIDDFPRANWGVICGDLVVVDADSQAACDWIEANLPFTALKVVTANGAHYYYKENPKLSIRNRVFGNSIDIRGHGGYVVVAGSVHDTGVLYQEMHAQGWAGDLDLLPMLDGESLRAIERYNGVEPARNPRDFSFQARPQIGSPVEEGGRNNAMASFAGRLIGQGLDYPTLLAALRGQNQLNQPPLSDEEVVQTLHSVIRTHERKTGESVAMEAASKVALTMADLSAMPEDAPAVDWLLDGMIPRRHTTMLGGHGGSGKSNLALVISALIAAGKDYGPFHVEHGRVLYLSLEDDAHLATFRLRRIAQKYRLDWGALTGALDLFDGSDSAAELAVEGAANGVRQLRWTPVMEALEAVAAHYDLIVIDNSSDAYGGNEIERRQVRAFVRRLNRLARVADAGILLLAHIDKAGARHGSQGDSYSGSTAWHNSVRSRLAILKDDAGRSSLVHEKCNVGPKVEPVPLAWDGPVVFPTDIRLTQAAEQKRAESDVEVLVEAMQEAILAGFTVPASSAGNPNTRTQLMPFGQFEAAFGGSGGSKRLAKAVVTGLKSGAIAKEVYKDGHYKERARLVLGADRGGNSDV